MTERQGQVYAFMVDGQARREPYPRIVPRRFRVPLVGEVEPECGLDDRRLERQSLGALDLLCELAADRVGDVDLATLERCKPGRLVGDDLEYQTFNAGFLAPILVERFHGQLEARR